MDTVTAVHPLQARIERGEKLPLGTRVLVSELPFGEREGEVRDHIYREATDDYLYGVLIAAMRDVGGFEIRFVPGEKVRVVS